MLFLYKHRIIQSKRKFLRKSREIISTLKVKRSKVLRVRLIAVFLIIFIVAIILLNIPIFYSSPKQYRSSPGGKYIKENVPSSKETQKKQTILEVIDKNLTPEKEKKFESIGFAKWSVLDNLTLGYRLIYPAGFNINYDDPQKVFIYPPQGDGKIIIMISNDEFRVETTQVNDQEQQELLKSASKLIRNSFEFIGSTELMSKDEKRF